jgi:hypothetical protein
LEEGFTLTASKYTRKELERYVQACGVTPAQNYLLLKKELSSVKVIGSLLLGRPPKTQAQRDAREDDYLLVCTAAEFYLINLSHSPAPTDIAFSTPRRIPLTVVQSFNIRASAGTYELHITMSVNPEVYYCTTIRAQDDQYLLNNLRTLLGNGFYGLTVPSTPHFTTTVTEQASPQTYSHHVTNSGRPERARESLLKSLLGKPKRS